MVDEPLPFRPGDWAIDQAGRVARVKAISCVAGETLFDLILYDRDGNKIGRESPPEGGPRTFEPCCPLDGWQRCKPPKFPMTPTWVPHGDGTVSARYWSEPLPPAKYRKPQYRPRSVEPDLYRRVLELIADGHNNARSLAAVALGRKE